MTVCRFLQYDASFLRQAIFFVIKLPLFHPMFADLRMHAAVPQAPRNILHPFTSSPTFFAVTGDDRKIAPPCRDAIIQG